MKIWSRVGLSSLLTALLGAASPALAGGPDSGCCAPKVEWVEQVVTCYRTETRVRAVPVTVNHAVCREEVVPRKYYVSIPEWKEEKRTIYVYKPNHKEVERTVYSLVPAPPCPAPACDGPGCHGCDICNTPELPVVKQKFQNLECADSAEKVEIVQKVCHYRAEERTELVKHTVIENVPVTTIERECYTVKVPYQVTIKVPVCAPACCR
ncbi:MAG TPA: hypothetical protein VJ739_14825 [Gemmataceae bacterium]|nr:hypothetical protein [Gemmataceae bacterium]